MKKIVFIGGTSRSGSTLLDQIMSNDSKAMSLGEIHALFHPTRKHHFDEIYKLQNDEKWDKILADGKKYLYTNLEYFFPNVDFFIDSSKDPFWIKYQTRVNRTNFEIHNILIFKTPLELARSFRKRGKGDKWVKTYIHYHKRYFSLIENFISVPYKSLVINEETLEKLCDKIGIDFFKDKKKYWQKKKYNTFFGSNSVRNRGGHKMEKQLEKLTRKELNYNDNFKKNVVDTVEKIMSEKNEIKTIEDELNKFCIQKASVENKPNLSYSRFFLALFNAKRVLKQKYRYFFPVDYFNKS